MRTTGSRIIVLGAGICGLAAGMLLSRDGHDVTILERDSAAVPGSPGQAWERWTRDAVTQFRQPHYLQSGGRIVLEEELPDVLAALATAGGLRFRSVAFDALPHHRSDTARRGRVLRDRYGAPARARASHGSGVRRRAGRRGSSRRFRAGAGDAIAQLHPARRRRANGPR